MTRIKYLLGTAAVVAAVATGNIAFKNQTADNHFLLKNVIALARNEDKDKCGSVTVYWNEALRSRNCLTNSGIPNGSTRLTCVGEEGKCCDSNSQTTCNDW